MLYSSIMKNILIVFFYLFIDRSIMIMHFNVKLIVRNFVSRVRNAIVILGIHSRVVSLFAPHPYPHPSPQSLNICWLCRQTCLMLLLRKVAPLDSILHRLLSQCSCFVCENKILPQVMGWGQCRQSRHVWASKEKARVQRP